MGYALGDVWDAKEYVAELEVSPTRRCSLFEGLRISFESSDYLELVSKELWRISACFQGTMSVISSANSKWSIVMLSCKEKRAQY